MVEPAGHASTLRFPKLIALMIVIGALAACGGTRLPSTSVQASNNGLSQGYSISPGDRLKVTVFDEENLTGEYQVSMEGSLQMPLLGSIPAMDQTANHLADAIATKLEDGGYVLVPRVAVEIVDHQPFYILGEVVNPGEYPHHAGMTLEQAIAKAGGYTRRANTDLVVLKRSEWNIGKRVKLDGTPLQIAPGDTITVKEAFF